MNASEERKQIYREIASQLQDIARRCGIARDIASVRVEIESLANGYQRHVDWPESAEQQEPAAEAAGVERGEGWRLLEKDERVLRGDEYSGDGGKTWDLSMNYLKEYGEDDRQDSTCIYRRRIPTPESVAVVGLSGNERAQLAQLREVVVPNLTKVCDDRWKQVEEMDNQIIDLKRRNHDLCCECEADVDVIQKLTHERDELCQQLAEAQRVASSMANKNIRIAEQYEDIKQQLAEARAS